MQRLLASLSLLLLCAAAHAGEPKLAPTLKPHIDKQTIAGVVVLVADADKVLDVEALGFADVAAKKEMQPDALFWIASMSKPITSAALMILVDDGKVRLDDPVEKYLPEFSGQMLAKESDADHQLLVKPSHPITVREVLSHTSGLPKRSRIEPRIDGHPLEIAGVSYALTSLTFEPGTSYMYANAGINTAGRIVETVSGLPFSEFLDVRLFGPLGMKDTTFWPDGPQLKRLAKSYKPNAGRTALEETGIDQLTYPLTDEDRGPCPAGGLFSTAADLSRFCRMLLRGGELDGRRYLSREAVREMTSTHVDPSGKNENAETGYGLAFKTTRRSMTAGPAPAGPCGHGGAYKTEMWIDPDHGLVTIYLIQHAGFLDDKAGRAVWPEVQKQAIELFGKQDQKQK